MAITMIRCDTVSWCDNRMIGSLRKNGWDLWLKFRMHLKMYF